MSYRMWRSIAIVAFALLLAPISARAADDFYRFQSALPGNACINVPMGQFQPGVQLQVAPCNGSPVQSFGYESQNNLTAGGLCLDGISSARGQPPAAGDPVGLNECDGSDHQVWELQPFDNNRNEIAIVDPAGLCVAVNGGNAAPGTPLVLAACDQIPPQGWVFGDVPRPVAVNGVGGYAAYPELDYYWLSGHRYCWYDGGWHGGGWYWCGENFHNGIGWGGPIGWHFWFHHGQRYFPHRVAFKGVHGQGGHQHGPGGGLKLAPATGHEGKKQLGQGPGPGKRQFPTTGSNTGTKGTGTEKKALTRTGTSTGTGTHKTFANTGTHTRTTFTRPTGGGGHPSGGGGHATGGGGGHATGGGGGGHPGGGGGGGGGHHKSDIRLKQDIVELGRLADGIGIYRFRYTNGDPTTYVGVMAQEVQEVVPSAVSRDRDGYLMVNYDRIGVRFMTWDQWSRRHAKAAP